MIAKSIYTLALSALLIGACTSPVAPPGAEIRNPGKNPGSEIQKITPVIIAGAFGVVQKFYRHHHRQPDAGNNRDTLLAVLSETGNLNNDPVSPTAMSPVDAFKQAMAPASQHFEIETARDTFIWCDAGTVIYFPAGAFRTNKEKVDVKVREFYRKTDYMSENLSTVSGIELLESAGTVEVLATTNGKNLQLNKGESIVILFPKTTDGEMQTFYGERDQNEIMNWEMAPDPDIAEKPPVEFETRIWMSDFYRPMIGFKKSWRIEEDDRNITQYFNEEYNNIDEQLVHYSYGSGVDYYWGKDEEWLCYQVSYDETGRVDEVTPKKRIWNFDHNLASEIVRGYPYRPVSDYDSSITAFLCEMPPADLSTLHLGPDHAHTLAFWTQSKVNPNYQLEAFLYKYQRYRDNVLDKIPKADLDYFILSSNKLEWINCDRFVREGAPRSNVLVKSPGVEKATYYLVFEEFNSMVCGKTMDGRHDFKFVPDGEKIKIVGLAFFDDEPQICIRQLTTAGQGIYLDDFKPFSLNELQEALN